ncbi:DUF4111 domain-containing protein [Paenibacillaceae bacterium]|nr:DUF4111 domain-containing protein [Paenibacillaceae bacterium]
MLPVSVNATMQQLCSLLQARLGDNLEAVYLYGSTALGAYIEGSSDIDFLALVDRPLIPAEIEAIADAHKEMEQAIPNLDIMGSYVCRADFGKPFTAIPVYASYYNKQLHPDETGADINPVTLWTLRKYGICVHGEHIPFTYDTALNELLAYVMNNLNTYWVGWIERLEQYSETVGSWDHSASKQMDAAVEWCTLGMLRQLYTIKEHDITSKIGAGEYGLATLPSKWHALIREAIAIKQQASAPVYFSQEARLTDLLELLRFIHTECNSSA